MPEFTVPEPDGVAQEPSPRQKVEEEADVPEFRFVTGRFPVTPVVRGNPVALVRTSVVGVPRLGVTRVGDVASTTDPEPVVEAAEMAVPLPESMPLIVVERVIAGVVVAVATVPAKPLAETTETEVTVPIFPAASIRTRPVVESILKGSTAVASVLDWPPATVILFPSRMSSAINQVVCI